jgi:hypothetical protein
MIFYFKPDYLLINLQQLDFDFISPCLINSIYCRVRLINNKIFFQISYLIVDEAITDLPMEQDPFEAAGQAIPSELPYNDDKARLSEIAFSYFSF